MRSSIVIATAAALLDAAPAMAQDWELSASVYGWLPGIDTTIDPVAPDLGKIDASASASDILDALDGAFMGAFTAFNGRWGFTADLVHADLGSDADPPRGLVFDDVRTDTELTMVNVKTLYRVAGSPGGFLALTGGLRYYDLSFETEFRRDIGANRKVGKSSAWTDFTLGVSGYADLSEHWFLAGFADVGGFGIAESSDPSWQVFGTLGYRFNDTWSAELGYRYLSIDKDIDGADVALDMYGAVIGITARF